MNENETNYYCWGPHEDYMIDDKSQWGSRQIIDTWEEFSKGWVKDSDIDYNVVADYYFELHHESHECEDCEGTTYNPETLRLYKTFYNYDMFDDRWSYDITQDGVMTLLKMRFRLFLMEED